MFIHSYVQPPLIIGQLMVISIALPQSTRSKTCTFCLVYLLEAHMDFNDTEWLVGMKLKNFEKDQWSFDAGLKT